MKYLNDECWMIVGLSKLNILRWNVSRYFHFIYLFIYFFSNKMFEQNLGSVTNCYLRGFRTRLTSEYLLFVDEISTTIEIIIVR